MFVEQKEIIKCFSKLSPILTNLGDSKPWPGFSLGITEIEYQELETVARRQFVLNGWFTEESVRKSLLSWGELLTQENLTSWLNRYTVTSNPKRVGLIMAGNIPIVGFHDFLCTILSGHKPIIKLSSDDKTLLPAILKTLKLFNPDFSKLYEISDGRLGEIEAMIATGSNNSLNYFEQYFGKYPHIFRKNRTSIGVLDGSETGEDLVLLGEDIFTYFGLGCRNISQIFLPKEMDLNKVIASLIPYAEVVNHHKYANNYDYNKAIHLMNLKEILDNGFLLFKESKELFSPLAMLFYWKYENKAEIEEFISENKENIQAIIGNDYLPFGQAQKPSLTDYSDGVDVMKWMEAL
jgi:hypothetical protein